MGNHPTARNVRQLKKLLAELPDDLPVSDGWGKPPQLIVYNHGKDDMHLQLAEGDDE
ncbi:MAG: hypothetical protein RL077_3461 [Verrucomicrobiota bacterium]